MISPATAAGIGAVGSLVTLGAGATIAISSATSPEQRVDRELTTAFVGLVAGAGAAFVGTALGTPKFAPGMPAAVPAALMGVAAGAALVGVVGFGAAGL
jgi:hypothetical protein